MIGVTVKTAYTSSSNLKVVPSRPSLFFINELLGTQDLHAGEQPRIRAFLSAQLAGGNRIE
jgi:hypothetical protein